MALKKQASIQISDGIKYKLQYDKNKSSFTAISGKNEDTDVNIQHTKKLPPGDAVGNIFFDVDKESMVSEGSLLANNMVAYPASNDMLAFIHHLDFDNDLYDSLRIEYDTTGRVTNVNPVNNIFFKHTPLNGTICSYIDILTAYMNTDSFNMHCQTILQNLLSTTDTYYIEHIEFTSIKMSFTNKASKDNEDTEPVNNILSLHEKIDLSQNPDKDTFYIFVNMNIEYWNSTTYNIDTAPEQQLILEIKRNNVPEPYIALHNIINITIQ